MLPPVLGRPLRDMKLKAQIPDRQIPLPSFRLYAGIQVKTEQAGLMAGLFRFTAELLEVTAPLR
jgi:hypothetical protein